MDFYEMTDGVSQSIVQEMVMGAAQDSASAVDRQVQGLLFKHFAAFQEFIKANDLQQWLSAAIIIALALSVSLAVRAVARRLARMANRKQNLFLKTLPGALGAPVQWLVWLGTAEILFRGFKSVRDIFPAAETDIAFAMAYIIVVTLGLLRVNQRYFRARREAVMRGELAGLDLGAMDLLSKALVVLTLLCAVLTALPVFGVSIGGLLAIGGIGGAIAGLAVKDSVANIFGAVMINIDQPFRVGDWVRLPEHNIEGMVEEVGWGQTTIRKFDKRPVYIPNAMLGTVLIENPGRMTHRRILEKIGIRYDDFDKLTAIIEDVQQYLQAHADIDQTQLTVVRFVGYSAYALDIEVSAYTRRTGWLDFLQVHQAVLLEIGRIIARHKAEIAFPTQVLQVAGPAVPLAPVLGNGPTSEVA